MTSYQKTIILNDQEVEYTLRKTRRARRLRLVVYCDASIVVSSPYYINNNTVESFLKRRAADWILRKIAYFRKIGGYWRLKGTAEEYLKYRLQALERVRNTVRDVNMIYNFGFKKISIKNQKLRWGSCSRNGNLNFNYKVVFLDENELRYLVAHELCHLKEFNHSKRFWDLVAIAVPNYKIVYRQLKNKRI